MSCFTPLPGEELLAAGLSARYRKEAGRFFLAGHRAVVALDRSDGFVDGRLVWESARTGQVQLQLNWSDVRSIKCSMPPPSAAAAAAAASASGGGGGGSSKKACLLYTSPSPRD